jgi:hypothetical protein
MLTLIPFIKGVAWLLIAISAIRTATTLYVVYDRPYLASYMTLVDKWDFFALLGVIALWTL